jgi:hypothetical protein
VLFWRQVARIALAKATALNNSQAKFNAASKCTRS